MTKTLSYTGLIIAAFFVVALFVTSKSYTQLYTAILLYPVLTYIMLTVFPRHDQPEDIHQQTNNIGVGEVVSQKPNKSLDVVIPREKVEIVDIDKRTFLKLIGTAGISFFLFSILGRRAEDYIFNKTQGLGLNPTQNNTPNISMSPQGGSLPSDEYKISEIDDGIISFYGFVNKSGSWLIMREDTQENSFRYSRGETNFSRSWADRSNLKYDYYHNLF
ncbi:MAG: hypothetical protein WA152_00960 [Microgenomates group bacterium]